jgi:transcriptional repressor NrdR
MVCSPSARHCTSPKPRPVNWDRTSFLGTLTADSLPAMRCPSCAGLEDRVIDSREVEQGAAIRRRRECNTCGYRFTTFERLSRALLFVAKRSGERQPFDRQKVIEGVRSACKNRPVEDEAIERLAAEVEGQLRERGPEATSQQVGVAVLDLLRELDDVAYLRFASVYKGFEEAGDFAREAGLLTKQTAPKQHEPA